MYYKLGAMQALNKLGMADAIPYVSTRARDVDYANANRKQEFWKNFDDEPLSTGEESSIGMPSPAKTGSENDYGYGQPTGAYGTGGRDENQHLSDRNKRLSDAIQNAFAANETYDQSYAPESAATQPHGPKMAMTFGIAAPKSSTRQFGKVPGLTQRPTSSTMGMSVPKINEVKAPTQLSNSLRVQRAGAMDARNTVSAAQPNAVGVAGSSRIPAAPTQQGGAPVSAPPAARDLTITAPPMPR
jgi:hypothetical protein